jgi:hypothetical protein
MSVASYFYFAATLPLLLYHEPPRLPLEAFLDAAKRLLSKADYEAVSTARLDNFDLKAKISPIFSRFQRWEINLRNRLAAFRAAARREDGAPYQRRVTAAVEADRAARNAFEAANPLQAEEILNKARWDLLSDLGNRHQFDREFFVVYALKLRILERKALLEREHGAARHAAVEADLDKELAGKVIL